MRCAIDWYMHFSVCHSRLSHTIGSLCSFRRLLVTVFCTRLLYDALPAAFLHRSLSSIKQHTWSVGPRESSSPVLKPLFIVCFGHGKNILTFSLWVDEIANRHTKQQQNRIIETKCPNIVSFHTLFHIHSLSLTVYFGIFNFRTPYYTEHHSRWLNAHSHKSTTKIYSFGLIHSVPFHRIYLQLGESHKHQPRLYGTHHRTENLLKIFYSTFFLYFSCVVCNMCCTTGQYWLSTMNNWITTTTINTTEASVCVAFRVIFVVDYHYTHWFGAFGAHKHSQYLVRRTHEHTDTHTHTHSSPSNDTA